MGEKEYTRNRKKLKFFKNKLVRFYNFHYVSQVIFVINWLNSIYNQLLNFNSWLNRKLKVKSCIHDFEKEKNNCGHKCKILALSFTG